MNRNYYDDELKFRSLKRSLESWRGTKYSHSGVCIKGIGSDCVRFVEAVAVETGAIQPINWPKYVTKNGGPAMLDLLLSTLDNIPRMERIWKAGDGPIPHPKRGWILVISSGRAIHHLSIVGNPPQVWHCLDGVAEANYFDSSIRHHLFAIYEIKEYA